MKNLLKTSDPVFYAACKDEYCIDPKFVELTAEVVGKVLSNPSLDLVWNHTYLLWRFEPSALSYGQSCDFAVGWGIAKVCYSRCGNFSICPACRELLMMSSQNAISTRRNVWRCDSLVNI